MKQPGSPMPVDVGEPVGAQPTHTALFACLLLALTACSNPSKQFAANPTAGRPFTDGGPPPGTQLTAEQMQDPVPRDEPPSRYGNPVSYSVFGQRYTTLKSAAGFQERGMASWYGTKFHGQRTSSGETYDMYAMTAAHKSLPLPTYVEVRNLNNQRTAIVRVNDRGPFHDGRIIDLSYAAAVKLGVNTHGTAPVEIRAISGTSPRSAPPPRSLTTQINVPLSAAPAIARAPATENAGLVLQLGAFSERGNAEMLRSRLLAANLPDAAISEASTDRGTLYRLRIGPLHSQAQVDALLPKLAQAGIHDTRLLYLDQL